MVRTMPAATPPPLTKRTAAITDVSAADPTIIPATPPASPTTPPPGTILLAQARHLAARTADRLDDRQRGRCSACVSWFGTFSLVARVMASQYRSSRSMGIHSHRRSVAAHPRSTPL
jgi:hypothetical protein